MKEVDRKSVIKFVRANRYFSNTGSMESGYVDLLLGMLGDPRHIDESKGEKKRKRIGWLRNRVNGLGRLSKYTDQARDAALEKEGHGGPTLALVICVEELIRLLRVDANRLLEKEGEKRIRGRDGN